MVRPATHSRVKCGGPVVSSVTLASGAPQPTLFILQNEVPDGSASVRVHASGGFVQDDGSGAAHEGDGH